MEASVATPPEAPPAEPEAPVVEAEAERSTDALFQWSRYVHVGTGAAECEGGENDQCENPLHFHAWVCLPNSLQARDIVDKARAARARRMRTLNDPESDSYAVLENELDALMRDHYDELVDRLADAAVEKLLPDILRAVAEDERFEHHDQDVEEYRRLQSVPDEERDEEEYARLEEDVLKHAEALKDEIDRHTEEQRVALRAAGPDKIREAERVARVENVAAELYMHTYYTWAVYTGTRVTRPLALGFPLERKFKTPEELKTSPPEVVPALWDAVRAMEMATVERTDAAGN